VATIPPTDIILDVARAADPQRYREAVERLARLRAPDAGAAATSSTGSLPAEGSQAPSVSDPTASSRSPRRRLDAYGQFEAFIMQSFVQSMLPKNATNVYGRGTAGEVWRSMLAERMGEELARSGQVGIAQRLAAAANRNQAANENEPAPAAPVDQGRS
jgi:peptidoglycan hydrolase FlgJ